jgi:hypothetical protein
MFPASYFALSTALLSLIASTSAGYDPASKNNVAIYYVYEPKGPLSSIADRNDRAKGQTKRP